MIAKYLSEDVWGYIDHIRQTAVRSFDAKTLICGYDTEVSKKEREDIASYADNDYLGDNIAMCNKLFLMVTEGMSFLIENINAHTENLILIDNEQSSLLPLHAVLLYIEDCKDYDAVILITNQKCYLMNDEGKTIERLS